ncbi:MAG: hypothetical protein GXO07_03285 [Crenarchaeota archaeon]|nr:hypothetical protein [Thermoproteota archaeon]
MLLRPSEALSLAEGLGVPVPPWGRPGEVEPPAYVKADVPLPHKTEAGAVAFAETEEELEEAVRRLKERFGSVIVQKAVKGDLEVLVSSKKDRVFGRVLVLAAGGIYASLLREALVAACPFCEGSFEVLLRSKKLGEMLGYRRRLDVKCLKDVLEKLCAAEAETFEINPLILSESGCWAVDVKVWRAP